MPTHPRAYGPGHPFADLPEDVLLISPSRMVHVPGACDHYPRTPEQAALWGWISDPAPDLWRRIGPSHPVRANGGNTELTSERRCATCVSAT
ncbi:hypothetical protein ACFVH6_33735 [Spirillospora sp. NPDC127200]